MPTALVVVIRPVDDVMRDWRVMTSLFEINFSSVLAIALVGFSKNRVQWFLENFVVIGL